MIEPRREVRWFARQMEAKLQKHDDRGGWDSCSADYLLRRIADERGELGRQLRKLARKIAKGGTVTRAEGAEVIAEAADVANFAMMIADNWRYFAEHD